MRYMVLGILFCGAVCLMALDPSPSIPADRVDVRLVTDEADAVLGLLGKVRAQQPVLDADWQRLFATEGYVRLKKREASLQRPFEDAEFKRFVLSAELTSRAPALEETLRRWRAADVTAAAGRALAYLPSGARLKGSIYPVIKPATNSFVFETATDPAIFLYLDPDVTADQFENTLAHELHHIGYASSCPHSGAAEDASGAQKNVKDAAEWLGAFGEGFAMLAAAGGPDVHPQRFSKPEDRQRWDRDVSGFDDDLGKVQTFLTDILEGRLAGEEAQRRIGFSFFGVQGPWYTVGWRMAVVIETTFGRDRLIECFCAPATLPATYNQAAAIYNRTAASPLALWSSGLIERLGSTTRPRGGS